MELYHGNIVIVKNPEIRISDRYLDFGNGFYTTLNKTQAFKWTLKQKDRKQSSIGYVSSYDFNYINAQKKLKILNFESANID